MSGFSGLLSEYIRQKGFSIRGLAQRLGMPSTTLTKLCNNTRSAKNQRENIRRICDALMLTPDQQEKLMAAFDAELVGVEVYNSRMSVKKLVESMDCHQLAVRRSAPKGAQLPAIALTEKESDSYAMVRNFLENACENGETLDLVFSPSNVVVLEMLRNVVASYPVKVRHIMYMQVSDYSTGVVNSQNIDTVKKIVPLFLGDACHENGYTPYYYYERSPHGSNNLQFPNVMISAHGVLLCTEDYSHCIYNEEKSVLKYFGKLFEHQIAQSRPLITTEKDFMSQIKRFIRLAEMSEGSRELVAVSWQPCLVQTVSEGEVRNYLPAVTSFREEFINTYLHYLNCMRSHENVETYFTREGLVDFAVNGVLREMPLETLGGAIPRPMRRLLLTRLLQQAEAGKTHPHIAREGAFNIARDAQIIYYGSDTLSVAGLNSERDGRICFVEELSTNWSVLDFLENLNESELFLSEEESTRIIAEVLHTCLGEEPARPREAKEGLAAKAPPKPRLGKSAAHAHKEPITAR